MPDATALIRVELLLSGRVLGMALCFDRAGMGGLASWLHGLSRRCRSRALCLVKLGATGVLSVDFAASEEWRGEPVMPLTFSSIEPKFGPQHILWHLFKPSLAENWFQDHRPLYLQLLQASWTAALHAAPPLVALDSLRRLHRQAWRDEKEFLTVRSLRGELSGHWDEHSESRLVNLEAIVGQFELRRRTHRRRG